LVKRDIEEGARRVPSFFVRRIGIRHKFIKIAALFLSCLLLILAAVSIFQFVSCFFAVKNIPDIPPFAAARFIVHGSGVDTVSARLVLCDTRGGTIAEIERSWRGTALSLEFARASFGTKSMYVPYRIVASGGGFKTAFQNPVTSSTALKKYFFKDGKTLFFRREGASAQNAAAAFSRFALNIAPRVGTRFGSVRTIPLSDCHSGVYYAVMLDTAGSLMLVRE
jgi:hypothetical protein